MVKKTSIRGYLLKERVSLTLAGAEFEGSKKKVRCGIRASTVGRAQKEWLRACLHVLDDEVARRA